MPCFKQFPLSTVAPVQPVPDTEPGFPHAEDPSALTLAEWLMEWYSTYKKNHIMPETREMYHRVFRCLEQYPVWRCAISQISEPTLQRLLDDLYNRGYSKSTINKVKLTLAQAFTVADRCGIIAKSPAQYLTVSPLAPTKEVVALTQEEQRILEAACHSHASGHLFVFLLYTGLRREEMIHLRWIDYDPEKSEIFVHRSKTKAGIRTVALLSKAREIIEAQPRTGEFIFQNTRGQPISNALLCSLYRTLREETGISRLTNHLCRHTFVTRLCESGVSPKAVSQIAGHANSGYVLDVYAHIEQKELRKAIYVLDEKPN